MTVDELIARLVELSEQGLGGDRVRTDDLNHSYEVDSVFEFRGTVRLSD